MALREVALDTIFARGDEIEVQVTYSYLPFTGPSESEIYSAMSELPYAEVIKVETPLLEKVVRPFGGQANIRLKVTTSGVKAKEIANKVKDILTNFVRIYGVDIASVQLDSFSPADVIPTPDVKSTIAISAVAIIFIVLLVVMIRLGIKRG